MTALDHLPPELETLRDRLAAFLHDELRPIEERHALRRIRGWRIGEGTTEVLRLTIARRLREGARPW